MILYHTTSLYDAAKILKQEVLSPRDADSFVSLAEVPILRGDIRQHGAVLVIDGSKLSDVEKVSYHEDWYDGHRSQASYIAGEGWLEQYQDPDPPDDADEDWEPDEDELEDARRDAEFDAFAAKSSEREWITKNQGSDLELPPGSVLKVAVPEDHVATARELMPGVEIVSEKSLTGELVRETAKSFTG